MKFGHLGVIYILIMLFSACKSGHNNVDSEKSYVIFSDLEKVEDIDGTMRFPSNLENFSFGNGEFASSDFALSGSQCIKLDTNQVYGLNLKLNEVQEGQFVRASIWQKEGGEDGTLMATVSGDKYKNSFRTYYDSKSKTEKGWVIHYLTFLVTKGAKEVSFYIFSGTKKAYFDDIKIEVFPQAPKNNLTKRLNLYIPEKSKVKLDGFINSALQSEIIASKNKKYVKAFLLQNGDSCKVKMKLKGDWTDHLRSGKTSYRIKMRGNNGYDGLKSFSIQHPKTRNDVHEWVIHQMAEKLDLLTTDYDFINVSINGFDYGVYALEEHFDKQLVESRNRREGPILKFDESGAWAFNFAKGLFKNWAILPYFESSTVSVFKQNRTLENARLLKNFEEGSSLLRRFKEGTIQVEEVFDMDLLAKFYVINELSSHNHALAWHNRRFYFNPITQKLEPILFDVIPHAKTNDFYNNIEKRLLGGPASIEGVFDNQILLSKTFKEKYLHHLIAMTKKAFIDSIFEDIQPKLDIYISALHTEDESYLFDKDEYYRNADFLSQRISVLDSIWENYLLIPMSDHDWLQSSVFKPALDSFFVKEISVNAYVNRVDSNHYILEMSNYHTSTVSVVGYELDEYIDSVIYFAKTVELPAFETEEISRSVTVRHLPKKLIFKISNAPNKLISKSVIPWAKPSGLTTRELLEKGFKKQSPFYTIKGNSLYFMGSLSINTLIYIPEYYKVSFLPGSKIEFSKGGGLIINNSVDALGTAEKPILFFCNDKSSNGVTILNAPDGVQIEHTSFIGLSNLNYGNWELTGAVNIYQSSTLFSHVTISGNTSEDALNIIRSTFKIDNLTIDNTTSDGFDADFCDGVITNSSFKNTGNDCIDFSGSTVGIVNIIITNSGDKGISGGERSTLLIENIDIEGAITGIASKDQSSVTGKNITISQSEYGFAAFQKKGEYAPAKIDVKESKWTEVQFLKLVDKGSTITLNGSEERGTKKIDVDQLYERFGAK